MHARPTSYTRENSFPQATPPLIDVFFAPSGNKQGVKIRAAHFVIWMRKVPVSYGTVGARNVNGKVKDGDRKSGIL